MTKKRMDWIWEEYRKQLRWLPALRYTNDRSVWGLMWGNSDAHAFAEQTWAIWQGLA